MESTVAAHVTVSEAQDALTELLDRVAAGERIVIESQGEPKAALISLEDLESLEQVSVHEMHTAYSVKSATEKPEEAAEPYIHPDSAEAQIRRMFETDAIKWEGWLSDEVLSALGITREDVKQALQVPIEEVQERVGRSLGPGETLAAEIIRMREE